MVRARVRENGGTQLIVSMSSQLKDTELALEVHAGNDEACTEMCDTRIFTSDGSVKFKMECTAVTQTRNDEELD